VALPTSAAVRAAWFPHLQGATVDATLDALIAEADAALAGWCGFPEHTAGAARTLESSTYVQYLDGPSAQSSRRLDLLVRPVASVTSLHDDKDGDWAYGASDLVDPGEYVLDGIQGQIFLRPGSSHGGWSRGGPGSRAIRVEVVAGFDTGSHPVCRRGIGALVKHWYDLRQTQGRASSTTQGNSEGRREETIPDHIKQIMWSIRLPEAEYA
jgi:hypothetical protein